MLSGTDSIYEMQATLLKTLAKLAEHFGIPQPAVSQHLAALRGVGIVDSVRDGREVRYQLADPEIVAACGLMRQVLIRRMTRLGDMAASYASQELGPAVASQAVR